jgi:hypothetical protein
MIWVFICPFKNKFCNIWVNIAKLRTTKNNSFGILFRSLQEEFVQTNKINRGELGNELHYTFENGT